MQQHTGQHLLSAVLVERFGIPTLSFHLGAASSTIDVEARELPSDRLASLEDYTNLAIAENRCVRVSFEEGSTASGLRKPSDREGTLRIVSIEGLDRSACGGTHVRSTGEIGVILLRKTEKVRGNLRIEFLCGIRAVRQARSDFNALSRIAKTFSSTLEETSALVEAQHTALAEAAKTRKKLANEVAGFRGRSAYDSTFPGSDGLRRFEQLRTLDDETRIEAQSFTSNEKSIFVAYSKDPPAVLLATSRDSGMNAGELLKSTLKDLGGRGGGTAQLAQGSLPSEEALTALLTVIRNKAVG
jgi:alanyl-tRNA synthetase